jgi:hypothetical protein
MKHALLSLLLFSQVTAQAAEPTMLQCPAIPEEYSQMLTELKSLKSSIKQVANCEPIQQEVVSLEQLLGEKRKEVLALIKKNKKQALTEEEQQIIRDYAESVTTKVFSTIELLNRNNYCFSEDKQKFDFNSLASITLDATSLLKNIAGPWAAPIGLGGQVVAGIFQGLDKLVKSRKGYDFNNIEHRENFVSSMCTYYNYRQDVDQLLFPEKRVAQLEQLEKNLQKQMDGMQSNCAECGEIAEIESQMDQMEGNSVMAFNQMNTLSARADAKYVRPLGMYTLRGLTTQKWLTTEVERVRDAKNSNAFHIGRDLISEVRSDLDRFLFEREAPSFIHWQGQRSFNLIRDFSAFVKKDGQSLMYQVASEMRNFPQEMFRFDEGQIVDFLSAAMKPMRDRGKSDLAYRIQAFHKKSLDMFDAAVVAYNVQATYCNFFKHADVYSQNLQIACESMQSTAAKRNLQRIKIQSRQYQLGVLEFGSGDYSVDWAESLDKQIATINADPEKYKRK